MVHFCLQFLCSRFLKVFFHMVIWYLLVIWYTLLIRYLLVIWFILVVWYILVIWYILFLFKTNNLQRSIWSIHGFLTSTTPLSQSEPGSNGNEGVLHTPLVSKNEVSQTASLSCLQLQKEDESKSPASLIGILKTPNSHSRRILTSLSVNETVLPG